MAIREGRTDPKIGPSDTTDTYYDNPEGSTDTDAAGTGERGPSNERGARENAHDERSPDRVVDSREAGLGGGLDEAEEARLGTTDEELAKRRARSVAAGKR